MTPPPNTKIRMPYPRFDFEHGLTESSPRRHLDRMDQGIGVALFSKLCLRRPICFSMTLSSATAWAILVGPDRLITPGL